MRFFLLVIFCFLNISVFAQKPIQTKASKWVDSVYQQLNDDEKIGQLIIARMSSINMATKQVTYYNEQLADYIKKYGIGGVCIFQGNPIEQVQYINKLKSISKVPLLFSIDGEWGVGMRLLDSVQPLPKQMMLGAMPNSEYMYRYGKLVAKQCKRMGIHMNYAPVMDVNNNPENPIINDRSFGQNKNKVSTFAIQYMEGLQINGVMACAKHFPGHGDVSVDSHLDLPIINKTKQQLEETELYPFKKAIDAGVASIMIAHLFVPAIDSQKNRPTSLSVKNIKGLLKNELHFNGLCITDALEMQGVKKFFPNSEASVESIIAGNDMLCLPDSIPLAIQKIKKAIHENRISWNDIAYHCKRVLMSKYKYVLKNNDCVSTKNLIKDLNNNISKMRKMVSQKAITLLGNSNAEYFPLKCNQSKIAYIGFGIKSENTFSKEMKKNFNAAVFYVDYNQKNKDSINYLIDSITKTYDRVVMGVHEINRKPANNFDISAVSIQMINSISAKTKSMLFLFGNAYAAKNWCNLKNLVVCYEDDEIVQHTAIQLLKGSLNYQGRLPVTVCSQYPYGSGITTNFKKVVKK